MDAITTGLECNQDSKTNSAWRVREENTLRGGGSWVAVSQQIGKTWQGVGGGRAFQAEKTDPKTEMTQLSASPVVNKAGKTQRGAWQTQTIPYHKVGDGVSGSL